MIQYCINTIICSGLLFLVYKFLLEKEKMHAFNRFYLLCSIAISIIAPLLTITISYPVQQQHALQYIYTEPLDLIVQPSSALAREENNQWLILGALGYTAGLAISLFRFIKKIFYFFRKANKAELLLFNRARLVLVKEDVIPHSFLNFIFLNGKAFKDGKVQNEILVHELTHVKQLHSLDVLFSQLVQCIFWFNPIFCFYMKAIQLNHEFLADNAAVNSTNDSPSYQRLLINTASGKQLSLASQFNYSIIKKRLVMISKTTSPLIIFLKQLITVPLLIICLVLFVQKETLAQEVKTAQTSREVPSTASGASLELTNEYKAIIDKHETKNPKGYPEYSPFSEQEKERLLTIFQMMSKEQQKEQNIIFRPKFMYLKKNTPTQVQLNSWLDPKNYGVWIGNRRINNNELANYKPSDFSYVFVSRLMKTAKNYGKHVFQVDLMTNNEFEQKMKELEAEPPFLLSIRNGKLNFDNDRSWLIRSIK
jgi:hypothetical protein